MCDLLNLTGLSKKIGISVDGIRGRIARAVKEGKKVEDVLPKPQRRRKGENYFWSPEVVESWLEDF